MTIIPFPRPCMVEVTSGTVRSATITDQNGTRQDRTFVGQRRFFVDVIDTGGARIGMWDGDSHADAILAARALAADFSGKLVDRTGSGSRAGG